MIFWMLKINLNDWWDKMQRSNYRREFFKKIKKVFKGSTKWLQ